MLKLLGNGARGLPFVLSGPAGSGKNTLLEMLMNEFNMVAESVSCTTRKPRPGEVDGVHYNFFDNDTFENYIAENHFLEYAKVFGNYYGTLKKFLENQLNSGKHTFMVIDTEGALQLLQKYDATFIFIMPPSIEILEERLRGRATEDEQTIQRRLSCAKKEIDIGNKYYHYHIVNDDKYTAYEQLKSIVVAEELRNKKIMR